MNAPQPFDHPQAEILSKALQNAFEAIAAIQRAQNYTRQLDHRNYDDRQIGRRLAEAENAAWNLRNTLLAQRERHRRE